MTPPDLPGLPERGWRSGQAVAPPVAEAIELDGIGFTATRRTTP